MSGVGAVPSRRDEATAMSPALAGARLQLGSAPSFKKDSAVVPLPVASYSRKALGSRGASRSESMPVFREVTEVRSLAGDMPMKGDMDRPRSAHEALMLRLKSRAARNEAENSRQFLSQYRCNSKGGLSASQHDQKLDQLLKNTAQRAEELRKRADVLQEEVSDYERRLERINTQTVARATDGELQAMNPFERSQRRILEDKKEEDLHRQREEAQSEYAKVHRRLQSELIELRDFKVLLREFTRVRLEKLYASLGKVTNGRQLRTIVREMIRHGAQRILQKLEAAGLPLENWMLEVLVNCCHIEMRIEDAEVRLFALQKVELQPKKSNIEGMMSQSKQERFEKLFARAWEPAELRKEGAQTASAWSDDEGALDTMGTMTAELGASIRFEDARNEQAEAEQAVKSVETELAALRRLLKDSRQNAAAVICTRVRQTELGSGGGLGTSKEAMEWGSRTLSLLVSEEYAKITLKELRKSAPHAALRP